MNFKVFPFGFSLKHWKAARQERQLVAQLKAGDKEALRQLRHRHFDTLFQYIVLRVKSPKTARDLMSEVLLKLWHVRGSINSKRPFEEIAMGLTREVVFLYLRWVAQDQELQQEFFKHFERLEESKEEPLFETEYEAVINTIRNNFLQQELRYQHSTAQG